MILVIGSGVAGITCAIEAAENRAEVMLVTPGSLTAGADEVSDFGSRIAASLALARVAIPRSLRAASRRRGRGG